MSDAFQDRKKSFEAKYKQDQELEFKVSARRNKLFGEWVAGELGIQGDGVSAYAKEVILADLDEPGDEDVIRKVIADIVANNVEIAEEVVREKLSEMEILARAQLIDETIE